MFRFQSYRQSELLVKAEVEREDDRREKASKDKDLADLTRMNSNLETDNAELGRQLEKAQATMAKHSAAIAELKDTQDKMQREVGMNMLLISMAYQI